MSFKKIANAELKEPILSTQDWDDLWVFAHLVTRLHRSIRLRLTKVGILCPIAQL